ncbi:MAG: hypothetical protein K2X87_09355 [Gemmataceae bacterium]|nr:hypothetical protein [Gemmataceae bacterium]
MQSNDFKQQGSVGTSPLEWAETNAFRPYPPEAGGAAEDRALLRELTATLLMHQAMAGIRLTKGLRETVTTHRHRLRVELGTAAWVACAALECLADELDKREAEREAGR